MGLSVASGGCRSGMKLSTLCTGNSPQHRDPYPAPNTTSVEIENPGQEGCSRAGHLNALGLPSLPAGRQALHSPLHRVEMPSARHSVGAQHCLERLCRRDQSCRNPAHFAGGEREPEYEGGGVDWGRPSMPECDICRCWVSVPECDVTATSAGLGKLLCRERAGRLRGARGEDQS